MPSKVIAVGVPRPQLSNVLKLHEILPSESQRHLINLDPGAQSQGAVFGNIRIPDEFQTFNEDQDLFKGKQDKKMNVFNNIYSR